MGAWAHKAGGGLLCPIPEWIIGTDPSRYWPARMLPVLLKCCQQMGRLNREGSASGRVPTAVGRIAIRPVRFVPYRPAFFLTNITGAQRPGS